MTMGFPSLGILAGLSWDVIFGKLQLSTSLFLGIFYFYRRGRSLGFNREKLLDLAIFPLTLSFLIYHLLTIVTRVNFVLALLFFLLFFSGLTRRAGWSYAKVADLAAEAAAVILIFFPSGSLIINLSALALFWFFFQMRPFGPRSGLATYLFLATFSLLIAGREFWWQRKATTSLFLMVGLAFVCLLRLRRDGYVYELVRVLGQVRLWSFGVVKLSKFLDFFSRSKVKTENGRLFCQKCGRPLVNLDHREAVVSDLCRGCAKET